MLMAEKADLISRLPNEILHHIMSRVSLKQAVQISTLSTSWRSLMSPSRLSLSSKQELKQIIQSLSESAAGFQTFTLHLNASFAVCTLGVNGELHLDFSQHKQHPLSLFDLIVKQTSSLSRPTLSLIKTLHLRSISCLVGEAVSDLCSSWSSIESLKIEKCSGLQSIEIESSECLKNLEISDCPNIARIVLVSAHNLNSLSYKGAFTLVQLLNVPNLVRAALDFRDGLGGNEFNCEDSLSLLSCVKDIESLQLNSWLIEALCCAGVIFSKLDFQFSRLKDLKVMCSQISGKTRDSFSCFLHITPALEELQLIRMEDEGLSCVEFPWSQHQSWHEPHLWKDYATVKDEACRLKDMKKVKMKGFSMERDELLWVDLLLHNGINLREMIVDDLWRVARVPYTQLNCIKPQYLIIPCPHSHSYSLLIADSTPKF
ncbi:F-box protein-like protein [Salvia divinorum]|uniref:F-box protein-like protein n=1 Tax=Salvia divinorum TaxID=28513 RepID=A0ABD1GP46_SALDI